MPIDHKRIFSWWMYSDLLRRLFVSTTIEAKTYILIDARAHTHTYIREYLLACIYITAFENYKHNISVRKIFCNIYKCRNIVDTDFSILWYTRTQKRSIMSIFPQIDATILSRPIGWDVVCFRIDRNLN